MPVLDPAAEEVVEPERDRQRLLLVDGAHEPDEARETVERDVRVHVRLDRLRERAEVAEDAHRVELVGHRAQEAALPGHARVVVRRLARADVGERLAAVEAVGAAGNDVDARLPLAPGRPRDLVDEPLLDVDLDAAERVDEVGEAEQVDERVVVDAEAEQLRDRLLERGCALADRRRGPRRARSAAPSNGFSSAPSGTWARLRGTPNATARPVPCCAATRMIVSVRAPTLPGPSSVPSSRIVVQGFDFAGFASASTRAARSSGATSPGPSRSTSAHSHASFGTHSGSGTATVDEQDATAVAGGVAGRLLVREDGLERVVAADGHVAGGEVRRRGQRDESGDSDRPAAARSVDDRKEAEGEQGEVEPEQEREEAAVDRVERAPGREREHAEQERGGEAEQHEPAAAGAAVQLPRAGHEHREEAGDQHSVVLRIQSGGDHL